MSKLIGLVGFGVIGSYIFNGIGEEESIDVGFIYETDRTKTQNVDPSLLLTSFDDFESRPVHLVVETANPQAVKELGQKILRKSDLLIFSLTSLADDEFRQEMEMTAMRSGTRIYVPHGAILGLDGIRDGGKMIETVQIVTTKNPRNLDLQERITKPTVLYDGSTKGACARYPRNVNVHAAVALAGLGFEKTRSKIIADPDCNSMAHEIEVTGKGLHWRIEIESVPAGKGAVTGIYTPESAYQTVRRICVDNVGIQIP